MIIEKQRETKQKVSSLVPQDGLKIFDNDFLEVEVFTEAPIEEEIVVPQKPKKGKSEVQFDVKFAKFTPVKQ